MCSSSWKHFTSFFIIQINIHIFRRIVLIICWFLYRVSLYNTVSLTFARSVTLLVRDNYSIKGIIYHRCLNVTKSTLWWLMLRCSTHLPRILLLPAFYLLADHYSLHCVASLCYWMLCSNNLLFRYFRINFVNRMPDLVLVSITKFKQ